MVATTVVSPDAVQMDPQAISRVQDLFHEQISTRKHPGAALAVYRHGKLALDLFGGMADPETGKSVAGDTMFVLFSSTKPLTASCVHILWERGKLAWDDPIAKYWPGFGKNGKESVTVRHVLTHQGGFPDTPPELTWDTWRDWDTVVKGMEDIKPDYPAGKVLAYHPRNYGWVLGELVRRVDGRPINQFLHEEVTTPLGMEDTFLGLPSSLEYRVSRLHAMEDCDQPSQVVNYNRPEVHQSVLPAGGGIATARDIARFYAMLEGDGALNGIRIMAPDTVAEATRLQVEGLDSNNGRVSRRSLGLSLDDPRMAPDADSTVYTFGHGGAGTSICWTDPNLGLSLAYITNGFRDDLTNYPRLAAISKAVREACR